MTEYKEEDYLHLAGIQHFQFCRRQWALIHIEQQWDENVLTAEGNLFHEKAHDGLSSEKRKDMVISRGMPVSSGTLGISGICDIVEFKKDKNGISIFGREGTYLVYPVEYKRGKPKAEDMDRLQLVAQVICLEEMFCCTIETAYLFYGEIKRRVPMDITEEMRKKCRDIFEEMHQLYAKKYTPKVKPRSQCKSCSLREICMPELSYKSSVSDYMTRHIREGSAL